MHRKNVHENITVTSRVKLYPRCCQLYFPPPSLSFLFLSLSLSLSLFLCPLSLTLFSLIQIYSFFKIELFLKFQLSNYFIFSIVTTLSSLDRSKLLLNVLNKTQLAYWGLKQAVIYTLFILRTYIDRHKCLLKKQNVLKVLMEEGKTL
jgi:hypothetical protein